MVQWEYKTIKFDIKGVFLGGILDVPAFDSKLNELGRDGWELVVAFDPNMAHGSSREVVAIFKRPHR